MTSQDMQLPGYHAHANFLKITIRGNIINQNRGNIISQFYNFTLVQGVYQTDCYTYLATKTVFRKYCGVYNILSIFSSFHIILPTQSLQNGKHLFSYKWDNVLQFQFCKIPYLSIKIKSCKLYFGRM